MPTYHLTGTLQGTELAEVWVVNGRISHRDPTEALGSMPAPASGTTELSGWIYPGLVDAHTHPGLSHGPDPVSDAEVIRRLEACRAQGVTHIREMGAHRDVAPLTSPDSPHHVPGLPKVIRSGRHIARPMRYLRHLPVEIEPRDLPAQALRQLARGDGWIKLVGDWIDRSDGAESDLRPLWPREILIDAVAAVHEADGKIAVHTFATETVDDLLVAGVDSIEHGPGMTRDQLIEARERGILIDPTVRQMATFPEIASHAAKYPVYGAHMLAMDAARAEHIQLMVEVGSHLIMGSDTAEDVAENGMAAELARAVADGMPASVALAAASYEGRRRLGLPTWDDGAPADLVIFDADPELDIDAAARPAAVLIDGILAPLHGR